MEFLGISNDDATIYEGELNMLFRSQPAPVLIPIRFSESISEWKDDIRGYAPAIFREDFFDPITRIRRGRIFILRNMSQPADWHVQDPFRFDLKVEKWAHGSSQKVNGFFYERSSLGHLHCGLSGDKSVVVLGREPFVTTWKIINIETSVHGTPIITLKSYRSFGDLPELDLVKTPSEIAPQLKEHLEKVENSINRLGATEVVDRCRDTLSIIFGFLSGNRETDLANAIKKVEELEKTNPSQLACWAGKIVARLHSRAKPNEKHKHENRDVDERDARLAIDCLSSVLKDLKWAKDV